MDTRYQSFSVRNGFYTQNIPKGYRTCDFEKFIEQFKQEYSQKQMMHVVFPAEGWQLCEYEGRVCIGMFTVYQLNEDGPEEWLIAFAGVSPWKVSEQASCWFFKHRQRNASGDNRLVVNAELHGKVYPVQKPNPDEIWLI